MADPSMMRRVLVTGGAGFIGSAVCRRMIADGHFVCNVDCLTYAGNLMSLSPIQSHPSYRFYRTDINRQDELAAIMEEHRIDAILNLAAESHVDRSIAAPRTFLDTNILGTYSLLQAARNHFEALSAEDQQRFRLVHVSTDEVFGDLSQKDRSWDESAPYRPSSPYSASKAASDHFVDAWHRTYGLPTIVTNCTNNYGPYQYPEKLIPLTIIHALQERDLPVYGDGLNVRDWIHVGDHVDALLRVLISGKPGSHYNIGAGNERTNLEIVTQLCDLLDEHKPRGGAGRYRDLLTFVADRAGHDRRYAIDASKIEHDLGWKPRTDFATGLRQTVRWYIENKQWWTSFGAGGGAVAETR